MRSTRLPRVVALVGLAVLTACSTESRTGAFPTTPAQTLWPAPAGGTLSLTLAPGTCITFAGLTQAAYDAFGAGSPDVSSVLGKLNSLQNLINAGDFSGARQQGYNIIEFTLRKNSQRALGGSPAQILAFVNAVSCYSGLNATISDLDNTYFILPTDGPQTLISKDGWAGISLPANPVAEPSILDIAQIPFVSTGPGTGPLDTKLDQYRGFYDFSLLSANNLGLAPRVTATVGVCPLPSVDPTILNRLRLGHGARAGFEITPPATIGFLTCTNAYASSAKPGFFGHVASLFTPRVAFASTTAFFGGGGVGGLVTELSPFAPVDPALSFSGGVGGTVTELRILKQISASIALAGCSTTEAPVGTGFAPDCRPTVTLKTFLGTPLNGAPITFSVLSGGGTSAPQDANKACGTYGTTALVKTAGGSATACWTLGSIPGSNTLSATAAAGGDVPKKAVINNNGFVFSAIANAPSAFAFTVRPATPIVAGTNIPITVTAVDRNGVAVASFNGQVTLSLVTGTFAGGLASYTATATAGVASFPAVSITKTGTGYQLVVSGSYAGTQFTFTGGAFDIVPAAATTLTIVSGNAQTALAGSVLPINPTVKLADTYGNVIPGATIAWSAGGSSGSRVTPLTSVTDANGQAFTAWTVGAGGNELRAQVTDAVSVLFIATGTVPTLVTLNQCLPTSGGDPFDLPGTTGNAFFIPDPGSNKTIKQVTLFISAAGRANTPTQYLLELAVQRSTFDLAADSVTYQRQRVPATVFLRGSNSEQKAVTFTLTTPIFGANGPSAKPVMMRLRALTNPDGSKLSFNTGPCSPGTSCKPPTGCTATEVSSPTPYPAGTFYRKSVGITVSGN